MSTHLGNVPPERQAMVANTADTGWKGSAFYHPDLARTQSNPHLVVEVIVLRELHRVAMG
jgi:hypothetical protein